MTIARPHSLPSTDRIPYLDIARTAAIFAITSTHAFNRSFAVYAGSGEEFLRISFFAALFKALFYILNRFGVPLFLMITGALMLPRDYSGQYPRFLKKNWLRLFITTELWLILMFWFLQLFPDSVLRTEGLAECLIRFGTTVLFLTPVQMNSLWYMEMILCLYLLIPIFSAALRGLPARAFLLPVLFSILVCCVAADVEVFRRALGHSRELTPAFHEANLFTMYAVYLLMGCFCARGCFSRIPTPAVAAILLLDVGVFAGLQLWLYHLPNDLLLGDYYRSLFLLIGVVSLFELMRRRKRISGVENRICQFFSEISFGIYFVHICIIEGVNLLLLEYAPGIRMFGKYFLLETVCMAGSVLIIQLLRRVPLMGLYLFGIKPKKADVPQQAAQESSLPC